jgi:uncharacterized surface protein with fasciclin (FAS1) repeats
LRYRSTFQELLFMHAFIRHPLAHVCLAVLALSAAGCATTSSEPPAANLASTAPAAAPSAMTLALAQDSELSTFAKLVKTAGLSDAISAGGVTVFAPTDEAFKAVPAATLDKLSKDPELLKSVLNYHVLPTKTMSVSVEGSLAATTLNGAKLGLGRAGDFVTADDAMVTTPDIEVAGSIIHKIDRVLMPAVKK